MDLMWKIVRQCGLWVPEQWHTHVYHEGKGHRNVCPDCWTHQLGWTHENVVLKKIKKISAVIANTELYGKLYLKVEWIFFKLNHNVGRETTSW